MESAVCSRTIERITWCLQNYREIGSAVQSVTQEGKIRSVRQWALPQHTRKYEWDNAPA